ncbi:MAG: CBS domain-containing protein [Desulfobulbaceae bacterium]|nr:CBS domain-containing protein [Desulfobulbaceae bacterium]
MEHYSLSDIIADKVVTVSSGSFIHDALEVMRDGKISCVVVMKGFSPVGIVTERNLVKVVADKTKESGKQKVSDIMTSPIITVTSDMSLFEAYSILSVNELRHLVVLSTEGELRGVLTFSDLVQHVSYESFVDMKRVGAVMTREVAVVSPKSSVKKALGRMAEKAMSCIVIANRKSPLGIITERDVSGLMMDYPDLSQVNVEEVMSTSIQSVLADATLPDVIDLMKSKKLRRVIVVDDNGDLVGIATQSDIVKGLEGKYIQTLNKKIKEQSIQIRDTELDLAKKTIYLDNILQSSIDYGIIAVDLDYKVTYFNSGAEKILLMQESEVLNQDIREMHGDSQAKLGKLHDVLASIKKGERISFVIQRDVDGITFYISARASGIVDKEQNLLGFFLMLHDVTARKLTEQALQKANDELEQRVEERTQELGKSMHSAIEAIALTVEMRDPYTSGHQRRVADLAAAIARKLGMSKEQVEGVCMAGLLHDIGKIRVPTGILCHPGELSDAEFAIIKPHPEIGSNILKGISFPWPLADIVLQHHERIDGSGYPRGLKNREIHVKAKILAVADVMEALSSHRPYRPALGIPCGLDEIRLNRGRLYDPDPVDACLELFVEDGYKFPSHCIQQTNRWHGGADKD